jgi:phage terminase large subunit
MAKSDIRLPPGCGADLDVPLLFNPYQQKFQEARRLRFCLNCKKMGSMDETSQFVCKNCATPHYSNLTAPRAFDKFLILAGRGGGKTLIGAHAAREEMQIPNSIGWVMGPTFKVLWDSTFPTLIRLIPPAWVAKWDAEHDELLLKNGAKVAFRSLEDPERARGPHGIGWGWFDEGAQSPERAYHVFTPTLIKAAGIVIVTTTVLGFDWTYDEIEKRATAGEPGYWAIKYWTEENPLFKSNPVMMKKIEEKRRTASPEFFAEEYRAERRNATGSVYDYALVEKQCLLSDSAIRRFIPEWPSINPSRPRLIGLDSGADHPFGAVLIVATEFGLIVVAEYLKRMKALSQHLPQILQDFRLTPAINQITWAANKNEANLRLEFALKDVGVVPAENKHEVGIQRVQSWMYSGQLYFAHTCPLTIEQMRAYRYAANLATDGQKKKEAVFKQKDELPDALRYALMAYPELPKENRIILTDAEQARWSALDERSRYEIERMREFNAQDKKKDLEPEEAGYPGGSMFNGESDYQPW